MVRPLMPPMEYIVSPIGEFDCSRFLALFRKYFDARIVGRNYASHVGVDFLVVEVLGVRSRRFGIGGHLEFVGVDRLELGASDCRRNGGKQQNCTVKEK